jgi:choline monooxygenase
MMLPSNERVAQWVEAFDPLVPIERAWTPPSAWYTSDAIATLERASVFRHSWQPVARREQLAEPTSYVAGCLAGEPYVVVRDREGTLRAFYNTCRHKGREVVMGEGRADQLVCGYHAWRYDLDGSLKSAPRMAGIEAFDRQAMSLVPLRVEIWGPWVFINHDPDAAPLVTSIAGLDAELKRGGWGALRFAGKRSWTIACNWKVYVDNYLDGGYHIAHMHPTLDAQLDMTQYRTECFDRHSVQTCPPARAADERIAFSADARIGALAIYAWLYPNFMLNRYGPCLDSNHVVPLDAGHCRVDYEFYFIDGADDASGTDSRFHGRAFTRDSIAQSDVTQREDIDICESVQRGLASSSYERGRYAPRVEVGEHHFHRLLAHDYRAALQSQGARSMADLTDVSG